MLTGVSSTFNNDSLIVTMIAIPILIMLSLTITFQPGFAQDINKLSGDYTNNYTGFHIKLPEGWTGFEAGQFFTATPAGFSLKNVSQLGVTVPRLQAIKSDPMDNASIISIVGDQSMLRQDRDSLLVGCKISSRTYVEVNGVNSEKTTAECGSDQKIVGYQFASKKSYIPNEPAIILILFNGTSAGFDHNLPKFEQSIQTLKIDEPRNIQADIAQMTK